MSVLIQDSFNRTNSTTSLGNADTGQAWSSPNGSIWGVLSNEAYSVTNTNSNMVVLPSVGTGDFTLTVNVKGTIVSGSVYSVPLVIFRYVASNNFLVAYTQTNGIYLTRNDPSSWTVLASASTTTADNTYYTLKIECLGSNIIISKDGVQLINYTLSSGDQTTYGAAGVTGFLLSKAGSPANAAKWDDLKIESAVTVYTGTMSCQGVSSVTAAASLIRSGSVSATGVSSLTASGSLIIQGAASMQGVSNTSANNGISFEGASAIQGAALFAVVGDVIKPSSASIQGISIITAMPFLIMPQSVSMGGCVATVSANPTVKIIEGEAIVGVIALKGSRELNVALSASRELNAYLKGGMS